MFYAAHKTLAAAEPRNGISHAVPSLASEISHGKLPITPPREVPIRPPAGPQRLVEARSTAAALKIAHVQRAPSRVLAPARSPAESGSLRSRPPG